MMRKAEEEKQAQLAEAIVGALLSRPRPRKSAGLRPCMLIFIDHAEPVATVI